MQKKTYNYTLIHAHVKELSAYFL